MRLTPLFLAFATLSAGGCAAPVPSASAPPADLAAPTEPAPPAEPAAPVAGAKPTAFSTLPPAGRDTCRAADFRALVGVDHRDVPAAPDDLVFRVACTTCPVTEDFNPCRITFYFEESDGRIVRLACG